MAVPDYQSLMLPVLHAVSDGNVHPVSEIREAVAQALSLTEDELKEYVPSGKQTVFLNRVNWAITYMTHAGLLTRPRRAHHAITERGREALSSGQDRITVEYLRRYREFVDFRAGRARR
jgi:restriction system protein